MPRTELAPDAMFTIDPPPFRQHRRQERLDRAVHRLDVQIEGELPVLVGAFEHRAVRHIARGIEQDVHAADLLGRCLHRRRVEHIEPQGLCHAVLLQRRQSGLIDVRGDHASAFARERQRARLADTRRRRRAERRLALEPSRHVTPISRRSR